jgi:hypothetical protein
MISAKNFDSKYVKTKLAAETYLTEGNVLIIQYNRYLFIYLFA